MLEKQYWQKTLSLTFGLFLAWFAISFGPSFFARNLNFNFFGWPFSFYMGAQGSLLLFLLIIWFYAWRMNRLDREFGVHEPEET